MLHIHDKIEEIFDRLFSKNKVQMTYNYNQGEFEIEVDGVVIEDTLSTIMKRYNHIELNYRTTLFKLRSYKDMIDFIERECLDI